jgi:prevent-host-death family protein
VVNVHEAKTHLSRLLDKAVAGDDVTIARAGTPLVRLVPVSLSVGRPLGLDAGRIQMADDFDAPLPDDVLEDFER